MAQIMVGVMIPRDKDGNFLTGQTKRIYRDLPEEVKVEDVYPFDEFAEFIWRLAKENKDLILAGRRRIRKEKREFAERQAEKEGESC